MIKQMPIIFFANQQRKTQRIQIDGVRARAHLLLSMTS